MLSMSRLKGLLIGLVAMYVAWRVLAIWQSGRFSLLRELRTLALALVLFAGFVILGMLWHRPMLSLAGTKRDDLVVDFHSHTNASHDVGGTWMRGFDAEANRRWHARAGFDAVFITDHNVVSRESGVGSRERSGRDQEGSTALCPGIEVSAWRAHIVLLGDTLSVDRRRYNGSLDGLLALLRTSGSAYGSLSIASLPEYRRNHWDRLDLLVEAGLDGFEIVNASPKANEITQAERDSVVALARAHNRFVVGVSDSHGWGATSMVWNLVRTSGSAEEDVCSAVLRELHRGFSAVRTIERHRLRPDSWWPAWLTPLGAVWETWRSMGWGLALSWLVWIWALAMGPQLMSRHRARPPTAGRS